ncbi:hypothetical protein NE547_04940 [Flavonifractor sp. DFI.6.63]|uniref:Uncharacterized protein n=1 Tax=Lawsonibacter hominis TaxID=2763053 RepID=A0A8J6JCE9_9FIRM|nr:MULTISPECIES: hypothetical protein [Oscillospiraceae]MBS1383535.1 hypothetical protein [Flavonifractor sp.]MDU2195185.1 hypothetical protein [Clostridiales bacterium]MDY2977448.1 hypothetical protein [Oscillospiraceae bacterium]MBC5732654.1 hypothetical protein [Lawsonibacter hominis]MCI6399540.1 hypothetical protein [Lawsonibacter sp.]
MAIIDKMEAQLRPPTIGLKPYEAKVIPLTSGEDMLVREATWDEIPLLMETIEPLMKQPKDFYDIVASRIYAELLGMLRYRVQDEYVFVGAVDGEIAGIVNGRLVNDKIGMSYHTITLKRGARVGAHLFAAKMEYHLDVMDQDEVWIVAESPNGFKRWMIEYELESRPECPHELGGVPTYVLTKQLWEKHKGAKCTGIRPAFEDVIEANKILRKPAKISV